MERTISAAALHFFAVSANALNLADPAAARGEALDHFVKVATEEIEALKARVEAIAAHPAVSIPPLDSAPASSDPAPAGLPEGLTIASVPADKVASVLIPSSPAGAAGGIPTHTTSPQDASAAGSESADPAAGAEPAGS